jgi:hypothetical protein
MIFCTCAGETSRASRRALAEMVPSPAEMHRCAPVRMLAAHVHEIRFCSGKSRKHCMGCSTCCLISWKSLPSALIFSIFSV